MSSSHIEILRLNHEISEKYELAIGDELDKKPNGQNAKVLQQHRLKEMIENIVKCNNDLNRFYQDDDMILKDEVSNIREMGITSFYDKLNSTREYYQMFPNLASSDYVQTSIVTLNTDIKFSGEEVFGKYLDLNDLYLQFNNLIRRINIEQDYIQYLDRFHSFFYLPESLKSSKQYVEYLDSLWDYLMNFFQRVNPLIEFNSIMLDINDDFKSKIENGEISTIKTSSNDVNHLKKDPQPLRLGMFNNPEELEVLGMDRLKEALEAMGLKCGGTLQDRAQRLWSVRGKKPEDYPSNLKIKEAKKRKTDVNESNNEVSFENNVNWKEYRIKYICDLMAGIVSATQRHAEKQQTRTIEEKEAELQEEEFGLLSSVREENAVVEDEEDDGPIYNPLNLPLGWDGKPIPFWLYKLHGLGVEYKCEICGNQSYWGRKAFDRHFQEWKHSYGMRCLGIPNTKHFHDITLIEDAIALYGKIKNSVKSEQFTGDAEEEFEDTEGNILNRRTYEDLARQGLL